MSLFIKPWATFEVIFKDVSLLVNKMDCWKLTCKSSHAFFLPLKTCILRAKDSQLSAGLMLICQKTCNCPFYYKNDVWANSAIPEVMIASFTGNIALTFLHIGIGFKVKSRGLRVTYLRPSPNKCFYFYIRRPRWCQSNVFASRPNARGFKPG